MPPPIAISKTRLLSFLQCPRRLWLEQYSPELEDENAIDLSAIETGRVVGDMARRVYADGSAHRITNERGLRAAVTETAEVLADGGRSAIFEATFDYDGLTVQVDVLDRSADTPRLIEVKSSTRVRDHHVHDCAIQAWTLEQCGHAPGQIVLAHVDSGFVYAGDGDYRGLFAETDLTEPARELLPGVPQLIEDTRATLAELDEPEASVGTHCHTPHDCPFIEHCAPAQGRYPVAGLGGSREQIYALLLEGYTDIRDVPEERLAGALQQRIWRQTKTGTAERGPALGEFATGLGYPRHYLDFETVSFAVPRWAGTRPYEALPYQWSCHVEQAPGNLEHREFLDLSGEPPMRAFAESLIAALGRDGPVVVYSGYEQRILRALQDRFADLAEPLAAIGDRIVDLLPVTKAHYYHPDMLGSWSIKSVLPTVDPDFDYAALGGVRDGVAAQAAYVEAISPETTASRREEIESALLAYCGTDTLALTKLLGYFAATSS